MNATDDTPTPITENLLADIAEAVFLSKPAPDVWARIQEIEHTLQAAMKWVYACRVENQNRADMIARYEALIKLKV